MSQISQCPLTHLWMYSQCEKDWVTSKWRWISGTSLTSNTLIGCVIFDLQRWESSKRRSVIGKTLLIHLWILCNLAFLNQIFALTRCNCRWSLISVCWFYLSILGLSLTIHESLPASCFLLHVFSINSSFSHPSSLSSLFYAILLSSRHDSTGTRKW